MATLRTFVDVLSNAVSRIEEHYASVGLDLPAIGELFDITQPSNATLFDPNIAQHASIVVAAAEQLSVSVRPPQFVVIETALSFHKASCLSVACAGYVSEILREAGPQGLHINNIASKNGMDPERLSRVLRLLATYNIFNEVSPDVFSNNRVSSVLDTGKPSSKLSVPPTAEKYLGTNGIAALVEHSGDEVLKSSAYMTDFFVDTKPRDHVDVPFNRAFKESDISMNWLCHPGNEFRFTRYQVAMQGHDNAGAILRGFPWETLPAGSKILDVGGGIGSVSLSIAQKFPELKFVIQDRPTIASQAEVFWKDNSPNDWESGRVIFQGHDFFGPQPIKDADVFLLRCVIHDWPSGPAIKILKNLRDAAVPGKTKLLMVDNIVPYACNDADASKIEGYTVLPAPEPLLANFGRATAVTYLTDIQMLVAHDGQERTIGTHLSISEESGWKITRVYSPPGTVIKHIVAEPV